MRWEVGAKGQYLEELLNKKSNEEAPAPPLTSEAGNRRSIEDKLKS